jgi:hypothetical protein
MSNEPTPRSREEWRRIQRLPDGSYSSEVTYGELANGMSNFAKQLERELAEVTKQRDALAEALEQIANTNLDKCDDKCAKFMFIASIHNAKQVRQSITNPNEL